MPIQSTNMDEVFESVHFLKVHLLPDQNKFTVCDHFGSERFGAEIATNESRDAVVRINEPDGANVFRLTQTAPAEYEIITSFSESLGTLQITQTEQHIGTECEKVDVPTCVLLSESSKAICLKADRIPLIEKTHEYHFSTAKNNEVIGRINISVARGKAVMSLQPEMESGNKIRLMAASILLLGICKKMWESPSV